MSYLLFVDESGHDQRDSPYEVLAGVAVEDRQLWPLIQAVQSLEVECFGQRYAGGERELKGKKLLKRKVFRLASQMPALPVDRRTELARVCLTNGSHATREQMTALSQAKIDFVSRALQLCASHGCAAIASIVPRHAPRPSDDFLRKDYAYLFERFFNFIQDRPGDHQGLVVFDELERTQGHLLADQMARYFAGSSVRHRAQTVIPEPFFVHSHLTTGVQLADLVAYVAAWGMRVGSMPRPERPELAELGKLVAQLEHHAQRMHGARPFVVHSLTVIDDLRPRRLRAEADTHKEEKATQGRALRSLRNQE